MDAGQVGRRRALLVNRSGMWHHAGGSVMIHTGLRKHPGRRKARLSLESLLAYKHYATPL